MLVDLIRDTFVKHEDKHSTGTIIRGLNADIKVPETEPIEKYNTIIDKKIAVTIFVNISTIIIQVYNTDTIIVEVNEELMHYLVNRFGMMIRVSSIIIFMGEDNYIKSLNKNAELNRVMHSFRDETVWHDVEYKPNMDKFYASLPIFGFDKAVIITLLDLPEDLITLLMEDK